MSFHFESLSRLKNAIVVLKEVLIFVIFNRVQQHILNSLKKSCFLPHHTDFNHIRNEQGSQLLIETEYLEEPKCRNFKRRILLVYGKAGAFLGR